jgi:lysophospholipase L1-like esterase
MTPSPARPQVVVAFVLVTALAAAVAGELAARAAYALRDHVKARQGAIPSQPELAPWERLDPEHPGNYLLVPGFRMTLAEALAYKRDKEMTLGVEDLMRAAEFVGARPEDGIFSVNRAGYKGPELDATRARPRILAIGDSCTFGSMLDAASYPRVLERKLAERGAPAEVVNAGLGGYYPANALARIEEFRGLAPELTLVYIGWNALWGERTSSLAGWQKLHVLRLPVLFWRMLREGGRSRREQALENLQRPKHPDPSAPELAGLEGWEPSFLGEVRTIVVRMREAGSRVYLVTLPGLFDSRTPPTAEALRIGHLPAPMENPYVLSAMTDRYNEALARIAREEGATLVDLASWGREALAPRHEHFIDSVHLTPGGQEKLGAHLAEVIAPHLAVLGSRGS